MKLPVLIFLSLATCAFARLGENEDQNEDRYGLPKRQFDLLDKNFPLIRGEGTRTKTYLFETWRIRVGYLNGIAVRIEYWRNQDSDPLLKDFEKAAILDAESLGGTWHPDAPGMEQTTGYAPGRNTYVRQDGARATMDKIHVVIDSKTLLDFDAARKAAALNLDAARKAAAEEQRKSDVPKF